MASTTTTTTTMVPESTHEAADRLIVGVLLGVARCTGSDTLAAECRDEADRLVRRWVETLEAEVEEMSR